MPRAYHEVLRAALFGDESLRMWGKETLIRDREEFIGDALKMIREDLEEMFDREFEEFLTDLWEEGE